MRSYSTHSRREGRNISTLNRRGDAIVLALVAAAVVGMVSVGVVAVMRALENQQQNVRVKNAMASLEAKIRAAVLKTANFTGCLTDNTAGSAGTCLFTFPSELRSIPLLGGTCPTLPCELQVQGDQYDSATHIFTATIHYSGTRPLVQDVLFTTVVPAEVLQQSSFDCPDDKPLFAGFEANGSVRCNPLGQCRAGQFITQVDPVTLDPTCAPLPVVDCGANQFFNRLQWVGATLSTSCVNRLDPYSGTPAP